MKKEMSSYEVEMQRLKEAGIVKERRRYFDECLRAGYAEGKRVAYEDAIEFFDLQKKINFNVECIWEVLGDYLDMECELDMVRLAELKEERIKLFDAREAVEDRIDSVAFVSTALKKVTWNT